MSIRRARYSGAIRYKLTLLALAVFPLWVCAQPPWEANPPLWEQAAVVRHLTVDKLGQVYVVTPKNQLLRYNAKGEPAGQFAQPTLGKLAYADVSDPLSILLWYPDFQTILLLDRTMGLLATLRLPGEVFPFPALVARGRDNRIWVFDTFRNRLLCTDAQGQLLAESQDLNLGAAAPRDPQLLAADDEGFFLSDTTQGLWRFDRLGQFQYFLPLTGVDMIQHFRDRQFLIRREGRFFWLSGFAPPALVDLPFPCTFLALQPKIAAVWYAGDNILRFFQQ